MKKDIRYFLEKMFVRWTVLVFKIVKSKKWLVHLMGWVALIYFFLLDPTKIRGGVLWCFLSYKLGLLLPVTV